MPLVVADTSPLRFLIEIDHEFVLPQLFQKIWIPGAVVRELQHDRTPARVRQWAEHLPNWMIVREVDSSGFNHEWAGIDQGESEAIELAREIQAKFAL